MVVTGSAYGTDSYTVQPGYTATLNITLSFTSSDNYPGIFNSGVYQYMVKEGSNILRPKGTSIPSALTLPSASLDGNHTITLYIYDKADNETTESVVIVLDTAAPDVLRNGCLYNHATSNGSDDCSDKIDNGNNLEIANNGSDSMDVDATITNGNDATITNAGTDMTVGGSITNGNDLTIGSRYIIQSFCVRIFVTNSTDFENTVPQRPHIIPVDMPINTSKAYLLKIFNLCLLSKFL